MGLSFLIEHFDKKIKQSSSVHSSLTLSSMESSLRDEVFCLLDDVDLAASTGKKQGWDLDEACPAIPASGDDDHNDYNIQELMSSTKGHLMNDIMHHLTP